MIKKNPGTDKATEMLPAKPKSEPTVVSLEESKRKLEDAEIKIEAGIKAFWLAAEALKEVRELKLYESQGYADFPEYLAQRWGYSESYVSRLISAGNTRNLLIEDNNVIKKLEDVDKKPENLPKAYSFYYALSRLDKEEQITVLLRLLEEEEPMTVKKLQEISTHGTNAKDVSFKRLNTAISTIKSLAKEFTPEEFFKDAKNERRKAEFIAALEAMLEKLKK